MTCIDLTSKRSKCWDTSQNIQNKAKLQKWSKSNDLHRFDVKTIKMLSYVAKHAKLQNRNYNKLHRLDVKTIKTKLNYKSDQNPMTCIDLTSKRSKCWVTSQNIQNKAKLQKWSKSNDLHRFDVKTIETKLNYKSSKQRLKLQKWSKSNDLHRFDVKTINYNKLHRLSIVKTIKTKLNYKSDQNPMTCIDLTSKRSKCWVTSQNIQNNPKLQKWSKSNDLHRFDVKTIGCQNIRNKAKLQKWSKSNDLHRFDVKTIKMLSYVAKHSKQS